MDKRSHILNASRDHLVHVLPNMTVDGCYNFAALITSELQKSYAHTILTESDLSTIDPVLIWTAQAVGADVCMVEKILPEHLENSNFTGAILYNVEGHDDIGRILPTLYYSYGLYDPRPGSDVIAVCSEYAKKYSRKGPYDEAALNQLEQAIVIPPMVTTRSMRRLKGADKSKFTVGILTSGAYDKYPCDLVMKLLSKLPEDICMLFTTLPKYKHPGMALAINDRAVRFPGKMIACTTRPLVTLYYMIKCDVIVYASSSAHNEPYGRTVVEAMALGKPVICERRGNFTNTLDHGINALLFDTADEVLDYIQKIRKEPDIGKKLGTNAQLWASWQDVTVHIGRLKRTLRMIGA